MTEKNNFVYKLFLLFNISDFRVFFVKIATPLKKVIPSFPATPFSKLSSCQAPLFEYLVGGSTHQQKEGGDAHYEKRIYQDTQLKAELNDLC